MAQDPKYDYDLFIAHAGDDAAWVHGYLIPELGLPRDRIVTYEDIRPGAWAAQGAEQAVAGSRYTLLVLSPAYGADCWAAYGGLLASHLSVSQQRERLIPLLKEECNLPLELDARVRLDCRDEALWDAEVARLRDLLSCAAPGDDPVECPYPGMKPYREENTLPFVGREAEVEELLRAVRSLRRICVIGPSGSGKSSLISAGLLPNLRESGLFPTGSWLVREMRPGSRPAATLREALGDQSAAELLRTNEPAERLLLVIDQFEQSFTQADPSEREAFFAALAELHALPECTLVIGIRADFYADLMNSPLWPPSPGGQINITPLCGDALRRAIAEPARQRGVYVETALVERLMAHAAAGGAAAGALPLLQETLVLLWERRRRRLLPLSAYEALGRDGRTGLSVAIATHADAALEGLDWLPGMEGQGKAVARRLLMRLVHFGDGKPDTSRRLPAYRLRRDREDDLRFETTLGHLVDQRLLTVSSDPGTHDRTVELSHDALIMEWPLLQGWVHDWKDAERARRRLEAKAEDWVRLGRASSGLLDPVQLREAEQYLASPTGCDMGASADLRGLISASQKAAVRNRIYRHGVAASGTLALIVISMLAASFRAQAHRADRQKELTLRATGQLTYDIPDRLQHVPGAIPAIAQVLDETDSLVDKALHLEPDTRRALHQKAGIYQRRARTWALLRNTLRAQEYYERSLRIFRELAKSPEDVQAREDLGVVLYHYGTFLREERKDADAAERAFEEAISVVSAIPGGLDRVVPSRVLAGCRSGLGAIARERGDLEGAQSYYRLGLAVVSELNRLSPSPQSREDLAIAYRDLGDVQAAVGDLSGARRSLETSWAICASLAKEKSDVLTRQHLAVSLERLADIYLAVGKPLSAKHCLLQSMGAYEALARDKDNGEAQRMLVVSCIKAGDFFKDRDRPRARASYGRSLAICERLAEDRANKGVQRLLSVCLDRQADLTLEDAKDSGSSKAYAAARSLYARSFRIRTLLARESSTADAQLDLAVSYGKMGDLERVRRNWKKAEEHLVKSVRIERSLARRAGNVEARRRLVGSLIQLGTARQRQGRKREALATYEEAVRVAQGTLRSRSDVEAKRRLAVARLRMAEARLALGNRQGAAETIRHCMPVFTELAKDRGNIRAQRDLRIAQRIAYSCRE
jgi:tetratricopeptide (TPR) repeat protein